MLVYGLASKNNRTRVEAAEAIGEIIHDEGVHVADKARHKPLPALAQVSGVPLPHVQLVRVTLKHAKPGRRMCQVCCLCTAVQPLYSQGKHRFVSCLRCLDAVLKLASVGLPIIVQLLIGKSLVVLYKHATWQRDSSEPPCFVMQIVSDRDKATRAAALGTLEVAYLSEGQAIWSMLGRLSDQQHSLIEERFKYTDKQV